MHDTLSVGLTKTFQYQVPEQRTVPQLLPESVEFSVMPPVLATGYLVGLVEWTCMQAINPHLDPHERTLGVHVDLSHDAATPPGATVTIDVELIAVEGRRLTFDVTARDEAAVISRGRHQRAVIDLERFTARLLTRPVPTSIPRTTTNE